MNLVLSVIAENLRVIAIALQFFFFVLAWRQNFDIYKLRKVSAILNL